MKRLFALVAVLFLLFSGAVYILDELLGSSATYPTTTVRPLWFASGLVRADEHTAEHLTDEDANSAEQATNKIAPHSYWCAEPEVTNMPLDAQPRLADDAGVATATDQSLHDARRAKARDARFIRRQRGSLAPDSPALGSVGEAPRETECQGVAGPGFRDEQPLGDCSANCRADECAEAHVAAQQVDAPHEAAPPSAGVAAAPWCEAGCDGQTVESPASPAIEAPAEPGRSPNSSHRADMGERLTSRTKAARAASMVDVQPPAALGDEHQSAAAARGNSYEAVVLQWITPAEVSVGQPTACRLIVHNTAAAAVESVEVHADLPEHLRIERSSLEARDDQGRIAWALGQLSPGQTKAIDLDVTATDEGDFNPVASVTFRHSCATHIQALRPQLELTIEGPAQVRTGEPASFAIVVSNVGTGRAAAVQVGAEFEGALSSPAGRPKTYTIGSLAAGETRRIAVAALASEAGACRVLARVAGQGQLKGEAEMTVAVVSPCVEVGVAGPRLRYVDHAAEYTLRMHNTSRAVASNVQVVAQLPGGMRFEAADGGATCDLERGQVTWFVGQLEPDQACQFNLRLTAVEAGEQRLAVETSLENGQGQLAEFVTRVEGIADVAIEVVDSQDPVELGGETVYEIRVSNRGSQPAHQVQIAARLSTGCQAIDSDGPTAGKIERAQVVFAPIAVLEAGAVESYHVRVGCGQAGQFGFRAFVRCQEQPRPAVEEELTRVYEE